MAAQKDFHDSAVFDKKVEPLSISRDIQIFEGCKRDRLHFSIPFELNKKRQDTFPFMTARKDYNGSTNIPYKTTEAHALSYKRPIRAFVNTFDELCS